MRRKSATVEWQQLYPDGKALPCSSGMRSLGLETWKCPSGDEEDVVCRNHAVLGVDGGPFDDGENVSLYTFAADVGAVAAFAPGDLVDLVEKDHAGVLDAFDCEAA